MSEPTTIEGLANGGYGVCRREGRVWFVPRALPGDVVRVKQVRQAKGIIWGAIADLVEPSPDRTKVSCPVFGICGGCSWLHFAYPAQGEWKRRIVRDCFQRIGKMDVEVGWCEDPSLRLGYRTRAEFHGKDGRLGFFAQQSHDVVDIEACPLCHSRVNSALAKLRAVTVKGSVEIVANPQGDDLLVCMKESMPEVQAVFPQGQSLKDEGRRDQFLFDGVPIVNGAFSQGSLLLNRLVVKTVHGLLGDCEYLLDLYCGSGNFSLSLPKTWHVTGMDHNRHSILAASSLREDSYSAGGVSQFRQAIASRHWDAIILDPPRRGAKDIISALGEAQADILIYVSCEAGTLARDVGLLTKKGWRVAEIIAVDLFPHTPHIETVCRLERGT